MHTGSRQQTQPHNTRRSGSITAWSVFALVAVSACMALAWNGMHLMAVRNDAQACAEACALAAGRRLVSDDILRQDNPELRTAGRVFAAKQSAMQMAAAWQTADGSALLREDDVHIGQLFTSEHGSTLLEQNAFPAHVRVTLRRDSMRGNAVPMMLGELTGVVSADVLQTCVVEVSSHVSGFRATPYDRIPLVPVALPAGDESHDAGTWSGDIERRGGQDEYSFNEWNATISDGPDGLPEITIAWTSSTVAAAGNGIPLRLHPALEDPVTEWTETLERGLAAGASTPGSVSSREFTSLIETELSHITEYEGTLRELSGRSRIWFVYDEEAASDGNTITVKRAVAARLMDVVVIDSGLRLTLQPSTLTTRTAITADSGVPPNPYIYRISIVR